jgi:hypothetical protein
MAELRQRPGDQPLPTPNDRPDIQSLVIEDIRARREVGIQRYGTALQAHNGRDGLRDLYEELLDGATYARQLLEERADRQALVEKLRTLAADDGHLAAWMAGHQLKPSAYAPQVLAAVLADLEQDTVDADPVPACRVCGCTEDQACEGGCHWVDDPQMGELCSRCEGAVLKVTAVDLVDGETGVRIVPKGNYAVICSDPCHIAEIQHDYAARTVVITLAGVRNG